MVDESAISGSDSRSLSFRFSLPPLHSITVRLLTGRRKERRKSARATEELINVGKVRSLGKTRPAAEIRLPPPLTLAV